MSGFEALQQLRLPDALRVEPLASMGNPSEIIRHFGGAEQLRLSVAADSGFSSPAVAASSAEILAGGGFEIEHGMLCARPVRTTAMNRAPRGRANPQSPLYRQQLVVAFGRYCASLEPASSG